MVRPSAAASSGFVVTIPLSMAVVGPVLQRPAKQNRVKKSSVRVAGSDVSLKVLRCRFHGKAHREVRNTNATLAKSDEECKRLASGAASQSCQDKFC